MRSFWTDPYLWVHLAGLAALPIFLEICFLGLAVGDPVLPVGIEVALVAIAGAAPILWMQWQRPFCIFSLVALSLKPDHLTVEQRKLLRWFKTPEVRIVSAIVPIVLIIILWRLYRYAPIAAEVADFLPNLRLVGLLVAAIAFLASNLFLQVPASVLRVLWVSESAFAATDPYPIDNISKDFTLFGIRVRQILPHLESGTAPTAAQSSVATSGMSNLPATADPTNAEEVNSAERNTDLEDQSTLPSADDAFVADDVTEDDSPLPPDRN